jgi:hypothetical protein
MSSDAMKLIKNDHRPLENLFTQRRVVRDGEGRQHAGRYGMKKDELIEALHERN